MLITCFQCGQQLDTPADSAGKRVHCPHCQHVIVVPMALSRQEATPLTALPSLELDEDNQSPAAKGAPKPPTTNLPPMYPLPTLDKAKPPSEDFPAFPSIDRHSRRRSALATPPAPRIRWGASIAIGSLAGLLVCVGILVLLSANDDARHRRREARIHPPPPQAPIFIPPLIAFNPDLPPNNPPQVFPQWQEFLSDGHRFKVHFPGEPNLRQATLNLLPMTVFEARIGAWDFSVQHRRLSDQEHREMPFERRLAVLGDALCTRLNGFRQNNNEQPVLLKGVHPGRELTISLAEGGRVYAGAYYVQDGDTYHVYVLTARGPNFADRFDVDIAHFFDSFDVLFGISAGNRYLGQTVHEATDTLTPHRVREHEFTALVVDPTLPITFVGTNSAQVKQIWTHGNAEPTKVDVHDQGAVEQLSLSHDGHWLAVAAAGEIQLRSELMKQLSLPGHRCTFTHQDHLLILDNHHVKEFDPGTKKFLHMIEVPDLVLKGLVFSPDKHTLAVFGGTEILLWNWPERKLLGRIEAHEAPIHCVAFSPDGKWLASGSVDRTIKLWNVETQAERASLRQHAWTLGDLAFKPDGKYLASAGLDGMLLLWDLHPDQPRLIWAQANQFPVRAVAWDQLGENLYYTCKHLGAAHRQGGQQAINQVRRIPWGEIKPNAAEAEKIVAQRAGLHLATPLGTLHFAGDGQTLITTTDLPNNQKPDSNLLIWDAATVRLKHHTPGKSVGAASPDGQWIVFASDGFQADLQLLELATNRVTLGPAHFNGDLPLAWFFTPDSKSVWVLKRNTLERYEVPKLVKKQTFLLEDAEDQDALALYVALDQQSFLVEKGAGVRKRTLYAMADGQPLPWPKLARGRSQFVRLRKSPTGFLEREDFLSGTSEAIGQQRHIMAASAIHPDGKIGVTEDSVNDQSLRINFWDLTKHQPILTVPDTAARTASAIRFSADGRLCACVTDSGWTRIVPIDWLMEHKHLLPCNPKDVAAP